MTKIIQYLIICLVLCMSVGVAFSQGFSPPSNVTAVDTPNDDGSSVTIQWDAAPEDSGIRGYQILRRIAGGGLEEIGGLLPAGATSYVDATIEKGNAYAYVVRAVSETAATVESEETAPAKGTGEWFHTRKIPLFIVMLLFSAAIVWNIYDARSGKEVFVRRIPGLEAVDEAIGRATEMGRSILYVLGLGGVEGAATIAGMTILGQVARRTADYETPLRVPCNDPIVLNVVREMVKTAYLEEGRPDAYNEDNVFFLTESQFAYAAGVDGMIIREKPAAIFLQGTFYAESSFSRKRGILSGLSKLRGQPLKPNFRSSLLHVIIL